MTDNTAYYRLSLNILKALGGDITVPYPDADAIWIEIYKIYAETGGTMDIVPIKTTVTENGEYKYNAENGIDAYMPVQFTVDVAQKYTDEQVAELVNEGYKSGFIDGETDGFNDGYAEGLDDGFADGALDQKSKLESTTLKENGTYTKEDGWNEVTVDVYTPTYEVLEVEIKQNGEYNYTPTVDGYSSVKVNVETKGDGKLDYTRIGYSDEYSKELNDKIDSDFAYTLEAAKKYTGGTSCNNLYKDNIQLIYGPMLDTSNVTSMSYMFQNCTSLTAIPQLDTSNVTNMYGMFYGCTSLQSISLLDTSNVTNTQNMFSYCTSLQSIPLLDTSKVTNMFAMFQNCTSLQSIPLLDTSKVTSIGFFCYSSPTNLTDIGGLKNLGMQKSLSGTNDNYFLASALNLTKQSVMNIINNLYDRKSAGYSVLTLKLNANSIALLSDEEIAIATNKGWTIS